MGSEPDKTPSGIVPGNADPNPDATQTSPPHPLDHSLPSEIHTRIPHGADSHETPESPELQDNDIPHISIPRSLTVRLFLSHFLSTWNSRLFEMAAVLFIAAIFPGTLLPMSVYALVRSAAATVLAPALGSWIDRGNRLKAVRISIVEQRLAVAASCGIFWFLHERQGLGSKQRTGLFAVSVVLACVEKLSSVMNLVAVERDWVVVITQGNEGARRLLNARMRRIDLLCKLLGPLVISLVDGASTTLVFYVTLGMNCSSVHVEYFAIAAVYRMVPGLRRTVTDNPPSAVETIEVSPLHVKMLKGLRLATSRLLPLKSLPFYFNHPTFMPSISLSLLYLTVLSSGQMITFLIAIGYTSLQVGIARAISTVFELYATWVAPIVQRHIRVVRAGIWFLTWQMLWLAGGLSWFFASGESLTGRKIFAASGLVGGVILSRCGLWAFDLCAQSIVQQEVTEENRGAFPTVEASFLNFFELLSYASTIVFSRPNQFRWPIVISTAVVYAAGGLYTLFVKRRRGHLVHTPSFIKSSSTFYTQYQAEPGDLVH